MPKEIIVLERTLLLLMGLCTELDPTLNPMTVIRPYLERFVLGEEGDWSQLLVETSKDVVMSVTALPAEIRKFMRAAHAGELQIRFKNLEALEPADVPARPPGHLRARSASPARALAVILEGRGEDARADVGLVDRARRRRAAGVELVGVAQSAAQALTSGVREDDRSDRENRRGEREHEHRDLAPVDGRAADDDLARWPWTIARYGVPR